VDFRYRGKRVRRRSPVQSKRGAEQYERQLRDEIQTDEQAGRDPFAGPPPKFAEFVERWMRDYVMVHNRASGQREKRSALRHHLIPEFGKLGLNHITSDRIDAFIGQKVASGLKPKTVNNLLTILRCSLATAVEWGQLVRVPRVKWLRVPEQPFVCLTANELDQLLAATDAGRWRALVTFIADTGVRFNEAAGLHWEDTDIESPEPSVYIWRGAVHGVIGTTKTSRARKIPLTPRVCRELEAHRRTSALVFTKLDGDVLRPGSTKCTLHRFCDRAGVKRVGWHALRHTFATLLCQRGVPLRNVQELLGHSTIQMTARYAHASQSDLRHSVMSALVPADDRRRSPGKVVTMWSPSPIPTGSLAQPTFGIPLNHNKNPA